MIRLSLQQKLISWLLFATLMVVGISIHRDFGISWDEPIQKDIGKEAYFYINGQPNEYLELKDRVYGVVFELGIRYVQEWLNITEDKEVYHFRHFCYFLLFTIGAVAFFKLACKLFNHTPIAFITTLALILSPRIFGHAFINPKDVPFLAMYVISFHALYNYLAKPGVWKLLNLSLCLGLLINFRIMGILLGFTAFFFMLVLGFQKRSFQYIVHAVMLTVLSGVTMYLVWPFLWLDPVANFIESFKAMSKFPWDGQMLFKGHVIYAGKYPVADYLFTWMGITIPALFIVTSLLGILFFIIYLFRRPMQIFNGPFHMMGMALLMNTLGPVVAVIVLKSTLYDDWRQLYFVYGGFVMFTGMVFYFMHKWKPLVTNVALVGFLGYQIYILVQMIQLHPYQHVYFNEVVPKKKDFIRNQYEMDYWGTSFYEGLRYIAEHDDADTIPVFVFHEPLVRNSMLLKPVDRKRFIFEKGMTEKRAKYYLTTHRFDHTDMIGTSHFGKVYHQIQRQNSTILTIWKHRE